MSERDIFIAALQIECPQERAAYLEQACAGDAVLKERVRVLLQASLQPSYHPNAPCFIRYRHGTGQLELFCQECHVPQQAPFLVLPVALHV